MTRLKNFEFVRVIEDSRVQYLEFTRSVQALNFGKSIYFKIL